MSGRPAIPKLSLAFKQPPAEDSGNGSSKLASPRSARSADPDPPAVVVTTTSSSSTARTHSRPNGLPKLVLPLSSSATSSTSTQASSSAASLMEKQVGVMPPQPSSAGDTPAWAQHVGGAKGGGPQQPHAVYLLMPGVAFPRPSDGNPPLTVAQLKERCRQVFAPTVTTTDGATAPSAELEFFRLSALDRLTDDTIAAPPGLVVAGARLLQHGTC